MSFSQSSIFIPYRNGELHIRKIAADVYDATKKPILMLHGAMSNGRVFYSQSGRGLACFLANQGYRVYVLDASGRGLSTPKLQRGVDVGQGEVIKEQLPLIQSYILSVETDIQQVHWCAHSWGGVLMASAIARYAELQQNVASFLTFGTKRAINTLSFKKWLMVDLVWNRIAPRIAKGKGYLPADRLKMGMDNESRASLAQSIDWVNGDWIDHDDGFDYAKAAQHVKWPASWFIAGANDRVLGNPKDVQDMLHECQLFGAKYTLLSRENGFRHDYGHADMLTHIDAVTDHFPQVLEWYQETERA
ncbi:alpha/beta fold hydrolase [Shewanella gelidii]|uniref:Alpha/beta hydrolase n=1 Tax=Shewanella gelidii TaxID=1642821 RepID=A0A917N727_9GAMM|nr:alpha/beta hydrolase [Shewanella gelidii]MCL1097162.1 alpha/beta hydrolase [Shewanella gelidii]GGI72961.1 alpha/beta hydrolase [Shewanella gelidii]